jgi:hypothetical protein
VLVGRFDFCGWLSPLRHYIRATKVAVLPLTLFACYKAQFPFLTCTKTTPSIPKAFVNIAGVSSSVSGATLACFGVDSTPWGTDWAWGLPLIVLTVVIHVLGLGLIGRRAIRASSRIGQHRDPIGRFVIVVGTTILLATSLHGIEAIIWAKAFRLLGAVPDLKSALLYSLNAITSYGHTTLTLEPKWELMGALEALNGWLLFGLTTAFLFSIIEKAWSLRNGAKKTGVDQTR